MSSGATASLTRGGPTPPDRRRSRRLHRGAAPAEGPDRTPGLRPRGARHGRGRSWCGRTRTSVRPRPVRSMPSGAANGDVSRSGASVGPATIGVATGHGDQVRTAERVPRHVGCRPSRSSHATSRRAPSISRSTSARRRPGRRADRSPSGSGPPGAHERAAPRGGPVRRARPAPAGGRSRRDHRRGPPPARAIIRPGGRRRGSSTTGRAGSAGSPRASPPTAPGVRAR
jgi:hypothetical protein